MSDDKDSDAEDVDDYVSGFQVKTPTDSADSVDELIKVQKAIRDFETGAAFKGVRFGEIAKGLEMSHIAKGLELGETFRNLRLGGVSGGLEAAQLLKGLEIGETFKKMRLGDLGRGLEAAQVIKDLNIGRTFKAAEFTSVVQGLEAGRTFKNLNLGLAVEGRQIGDTFRELRSQLGLFGMGKEFLTLGRTIQDFRALPIGMVANSDFVRSLTSIGTVASQINRLTVEPGSTMFRAAQAAAELSTAFKSTLPDGMLDFFNSSRRTQLFDLIHSGRINVGQVVESLEDTILNGEAVEELPGVESGTSIADAHNEVVSALLNRGSLRGISPAAMRYFIYFMIFVVLPAIVAFSNQAFELQKNIGGLFTKVETPAEARAQARHLPDGAEKSQLTGFRIVTGESVYLMEGPSRQAEEVLKIRIGSLVQVLDSAEKSWLYVSVVLDDELYEGWILRRYTKRIE